MIALIETIAIMTYLLGAAKLIWDLAGAVVMNDPRLARAGMVFAIVCIVVWPLMCVVLLYDILGTRHKNVQSRRVM